MTENEELIKKLDDEYANSLMNMPIHVGTVIKIIAQYQYKDINIVELITEYASNNIDFDFDVFVDTISTSKYAHIRNILRSNLLKFNYSPNEEEDIMLKLF